MSQLPRHSRRASQGMGLCLAAALLVSAAPTRTAEAGGQPSWVPIGPAGGAIEVLAATPGGIVYAGATWGAGVLRSDDGGRHWRPSGNGLPAPLIVTALAVVPGRPEIVYAGGDQSGPYLSTDGGGSWLPAADGFASSESPLVAALAATSEGSAVYALASDGRLYKTPPGRRSWSRIVLPDLAASITADPQRPSTLYVGAATGIYRTRDGGETWSLLGSGFLPAFNAPIEAAVDPAAPGSLYALSRTTVGSSLRLGLFLFHSLDDGLNWVSHRVPLPAGSSFNSLVVEPGGKVLLAPVSNNPTPAPALLETSDGGATWAVAADEPRDDFIQALLTAPGETATVYAAGPRGFWLSDDAGDRWRASNAGLYAQLLTSVRIGSNGSSSFLYASAEDLFSGESFLFRRETGGAWKAVGGASYAVVGVDPLRPEIVYGSLPDDNGDFYRLWKSYDGGLTWSALGFPEGERIDVFKIDPGSPRTLYVGSTPTAPTDSLCHLSKSTDGGKTWSCLLTNPDTDTSALLIDPTRTSTLYLVSSSGQLYASRDGGATWSPAARGLPSYQAVSILALDPSDSRRLYTAVQVDDQTAAVYVSDDRAGSWTLLAQGLIGPITSLAVDRRQPLTLYAGVIATGVFRSTDGGRHWDRFDAGLPPGSFIGGFLFDPLQPSIVYTVTDAEGVYMLDTAQP